MVSGSGERAARKTEGRASERLAEELAGLSDDDRALLARFGFDREALLVLADDPNALRRHDTSGAKLPEPGDVRELPALGSPEYERLVALGEEALRNGECALVVLAGGMATRMGGVVKALVEVDSGKTFLDLRLAEQRSLGERYGEVPPLWLLTSMNTDALIVDALAASSSRERLGSDLLATFVQRLSLRLNDDRSLYRDEDGNVGFYAPGHGDFPEALRKSGLLERFVARGGRYVLMTNLDNLGGGLDPALIGLHLESQSAVTCEVVDKWDGDRGGIPLRVGERRVILEEFLVPSSVDPADVRVFNSNTLAFDAKALLEMREALSYFPVHKETSGRKVLQFERMVHEITFSTETSFVRVPRKGTAGRFLPIKNHADLTHNRSELLALAEERGMLRQQK